MKLQRIGVCALAVAALVATVPVSARAQVQPAAPASSAPSTPPNILFVLTDDLALGDIAVMPNTSKLVGDAGATFDNYLISDSVCCPSRVSALRGQYAHNTGVKTNGGTNGGFNSAYISGIEHDTIATRLQDAGYRTGLFGKYLNHYPGVAGETYVPPGWTDWASPVKGVAYRQYNYTVNHNGQLEAYGKLPSDHADDVFVNLTQQFIQRSVRERSPFFAYLPVYAPHSPAVAAKRDIGSFDSESAPRSAAFDQSDVKNMPSYIRSLPRFRDLDKERIDRLYRKRLASLQAVDRGIAQLVDTLHRLGALDNTYIVFSSDNGFHMGDHRLPAGKGTAYDTDIRVPLMVRGPGIAAGTRISAMAGNVDLAPTFESWADLAHPAITDGRSLVSLLRTGEAPDGWRVRYLVEHWRETTGSAEGGGAVEPPDLDSKVGKRTGPGFGKGVIDDQTLLNRFGKIPDYSAVRTKRYLYVEYSTGERELYDVQRDPDQTNNQARKVPTKLQRTLAEQLDALRSCHGQSCRTADSPPTTR